MSATYNLKNQGDYEDFHDMVIDSLLKENPTDKDGYPLTEDKKRIDIDYLWDEFGHELDGTQSGLGYQVFGEVIEFFNHWVEPITPERKQEVIEMAESDYDDAYECGQLNEDDCEFEILLETGLTTKQEQETYTKVYEELMYK